MVLPDGMVASNSNWAYGVRKLQENRCCSTASPQTVAQPFDDNEGRFRGRACEHVRI
jgi:hypothetical protein